MLSSHSQLARACRALCTAAALALLPQGAAWAGEDVAVTIVPLNAIINAFPFPIVAHVVGTHSSASPTGTVNFKVNGHFVGSAPVNNYVAPFNLTSAYFRPNGQSFPDPPNVVEADYLGDGCFNPGSGTAEYDDLASRQARAKSAHVRPRSVPARTHAGRAAQRAADPSASRNRSGQAMVGRPTRTKLTPIPPNLVAGQDVYVTLSAQVLDCNDASIYPQGNVDFCNTTNDHRLGAVNTDAVGVANLTLPVASGLSIGSNIVTAKFTPANASWGMSTDQATVRVQPPPEAKAKGKAKTVSRPYINCSGSISTREMPRRGMRPQAPPGKGTR